MTNKTNRHTRALFALTCTYLHMYVYTYVIHAVICIYKFNVKSDPVGIF